MEIVKKESEWDSMLDIGDATSIHLKVIPELSKEKYNTSYKSFIYWQKEQKINSFSENVLLAYFDEISKKFKLSTIWTHYSMLKATLSINHNVDIAKYAKLRAFFKRMSNEYRPKRSKVFTTKEINRFIKEAPDEEYLLAKAILTLGVMGACSRGELYKMKINDFTDLGSAASILVPSNSKTKTARKFTIRGRYYEILRKYVDLRPQNANEPFFFLNYVKGKCTDQKLGINKLGNMGKQIAMFLKLPNPKLYTGHCFRKSSARILGEDLASLRRHRWWKSSAFIEGYIDEPENNKYDLASKITNSIDKAEEMKTENIEPNENESEWGCILEPENGRSNLIPEMSKDRYINTYKLFMEWQNKQKMLSFSENVLMAYFVELSKKYKASSMWAQYSMLRMTIKIHNDVDIALYAKLRAFLKKISHEYRPKKTKIFTSLEINRFIKESPDNEYLSLKVALILGIMGACRRNELYRMKISDFRDLGSAVLVEVPTARRKTRKFTIRGRYYEIIKKYLDLRPQNIKETRFFLHYHKGKCIDQRIGLNKFGAMGKQIATFLKLPNPELYTGNCFCKSSATFFDENTQDISYMKRLDESLGSNYKTTGEISSSLKNTANMTCAFPEDKLSENKYDMTNKIIDTLEKSVNATHCDTAGSMGTSESRLESELILGSQNSNDLSLIPQISRERYSSAYKLFMCWQDKQKIYSFSEDVLITYFVELSKKYKASSLWAHYSMLRTTLKIHNSINIAMYAKLRAFLKKISRGYRPTKSKTFTSHEINKFIREAPDNEYLMIKVALIMGVIGVCHRDELYNMKVTDIKDFGSAVLVEVPTKTKSVRKFTITGHYYNVFKKYFDLRPENFKGSCFFLTYMRGKCIAKRVGIHKFGSMGKQIAKFLKLSNPELYTGHCFRKSSPTFFVRDSEDTSFLKRLYRSNSTLDTEGSRINELSDNKCNIISKITDTNDNTVDTCVGSNKHTDKLEDNYEITSETEMFEKFVNIKHTDVKDEPMENKYGIEDNTAHFDVTESIEISENELETSPNLETENNTSIDVIPEVSKHRYENAYKLFMDWRNKHEIFSLSENIFITYFEELSKKYKASTLWVQYSMLRMTIKIHNNVDISLYAKVRELLKNASRGYCPKKTSIFTSDEINRFIREAPDKEYLLTKVVLIMGVMGACHSDELYRMKKCYFKDLGSAVSVEVPSVRTKNAKRFTITGHYYEIFKKYANLRPKNFNEPYFFLSYQKGRCIAQKVGKNKFGVMGKQVAKFLKLPNPELYTGHCFRKSSVTFLAEDIEDISSLKGCNESETIEDDDEVYINQSLDYKCSMTNKITDLCGSPTSISYFNEPSENKYDIDIKMNSFYDSPQCHVKAEPLKIEYDPINNSRDFTENSLNIPYSHTEAYSDNELENKNDVTDENRDSETLESLMHILENTETTNCHIKDEPLENEYDTTSNRIDFIGNSSNICFVQTGACINAALENKYDLSNENRQSESSGSVMYILENTQTTELHMKNEPLENEFDTTNNSIDLIKTSSDILYSQTEACFNDVLENEYDITNESSGSLESSGNIMHILENTETIENEFEHDGITETFNNPHLNSIPEISKHRYTAVYKLFMEWLKERRIRSLSEDTLLAYFCELSEKFRVSTLWAQYSMLKTTLNINNNVDIASYAKLREFLSQKTKGYKPKKAKGFTSEEIERFIREAPDDEYLLAKVVLIMGVMGACHREELYGIKVTDFKDLGSAVLVGVPSMKLEITKEFLLTGLHYEIFRKYVDLRPPNVNESGFFLNYQNGKCIAQKLGKNKLGRIGKQIAAYLKLPNPESYTGHCFRKSSATMLYNVAKKVRKAKFSQKQGGWESNSNIERCNGGLVIKRECE